MKNLLKKSFLVLLAMLLTLSMVACTADKDGGFDDDDDAGKKNDGNKGKISFSVSYNDTVIELGKPATAVLSSLGEPDAKQEVFDCGEGNSRIYYQFASFDLYTMKVNGEEVIDQIELLDDLSETAAGILIGSSESAVRNAYGSPTTEKNGKLTYSSGENHLIIKIVEGKVSEIGLLRKTK